MGTVGTMDLAYVCEWEKWPKSTHCPSVPLACAWSCRNLIAFTTDLRNDDQGGSLPSPLLPAPSEMGSQGLKPRPSALGVGHCHLQEAEAQSPPMPGTWGCPGEGNRGWTG